MGRTLRRARLALPALILASALVTPARAQPPASPFARFEVPDSLLEAAVAASGNEYESVWNSLLVAELRAISGSKNALVTERAAQLLALARKVAKAESETLGTHIGGDALSLRYRWMPSERDQRVEAAVAESLAVLAQAQRQLDRAESQFRTALALYRKLGERRREAWVVGSLGVVGFARGEVARADSIYREALLLRRRLGDPRLIGNTLNALGITSQQLRRYAVAHDYFQEARAVREGLGDQAGLANSLNLLGQTAVQLGQPDSAALWYGQALAFAVAAGDSARTAEVVLYTGLLRASLGEHASALALFDRALVIARARSDVRLLAGVERSTSEVRRRQGRFAEAAQGLGRTIALDEQLGDPLLLAQDLLALGRVAVNLRDPALGRTPLERALALGDSIHSASIQSQVLINLSTLVGMEGDPRGAQRLCARALAQAVAAGDSELVHGAASTLGQQLAEHGDFKGARAWYERALAAGRGLAEEDRASDHHNVAVVAARTGRYDDAERDYRVALEMAERIGLPDVAWPAILGLGDLAERRGDLLKALALDRSAAAMIDSLRAEQGAESQSIAVLGRRLFTFEAVIHLLGKLEPRYPDSSYAAEAFQWAERARARAFLDLIEGAAARSGTGERAPAAPVKVRSLKDARALLRSDREALLEYSVGDSSTSLWVVTRRGARHLVLPPRATLRARAENFRRGLGDPSGAERRSTLNASRALYRSLIEPAEGDLGAVSHLIVSADDALLLVPFEALLSRDVEAENAVPAPGSYLAERFAVSYVPSATVLATLREPAKANIVVALGDPRFAEPGAVRGAGPALAPLPNTAAEVATLRSLAGSRRFVALTGSDATRARLLALPELSDAGVLHLATHGVADESEPAHSGLWLAPEPAPEGTPAAPGFLAVDDILGMKLKSEVVTLSACETGLGRLERGEGVLGLTSAFLAAGARSVVVSLWSVNDRSTAMLMQGFYRALLQRGLAREDALAEAKRALLAAPETRSPYYWAPFVLVGESGKLR